MNSRVFSVMVVAGFGAALYATPSPAGVHVDVNVGIPPPPVVAFPGPPSVVIVPHTRVYYVPEGAYDMYRFGPYWYIDRDGYWYRSRDYGGPFTVVAFADVPRPIVALPPHYHHHPLRPRGGPPGHLRHFRHGDEHERHER